MLMNIYKKLNANIVQIYRYKKLNKIQPLYLDQKLLLNHIRIKDIFRVNHTFADVFHYSFLSRCIIFIHLIIAMKRAFYVLYLNDKVVGVFWIYINALEWRNNIIHLASYYISPSFRGRNYGKILVKSVLADVKKNDLVFGVAAKVKLDNIKSLHLLEECGFKIQYKDSSIIYLKNEWL